VTRAIIDVRDIDLRSEKPVGSLLWYRSNKSLEPARRRRAVLDNSVDKVCNHWCQFNGAVLEDPVWNSVKPW